VRVDFDVLIEAVRRFNRFYTRRIGVLDEGLLAGSFTLTQARVLFEFGTRRGARSTARWTEDRAILSAK
jgi:hypothetical protein